MAEAVYSGSLGCRDTAVVPVLVQVLGSGRESTVI